MIGMSARPFSVSEYSTRGGTSGKVWRSTMPSSSSARRRSDSVRGLMPVSERSSSQKREQPSARSRTSSSVHLPQTISAVRQTGQLSSTGMPPLYQLKSWRLALQASRAPGWPSPGHGARTSSSRASDVARTSWRSAGAKIVKKPGPGGHGALVVADLDLALDDDEVGALVDLVVLELIAGGQIDDDRARLAARGAQDDGVARLNVDAAQVPVLHKPMLHAEWLAAGLGVGEVVHRRAALAVGGDEQLEVVRAGRGLQRLLHRRRARP